MRKSSIPAFCLDVIHIYPKLIMPELDRFLITGLKTWEKQVKEDKTSPFPWRAKLEANMNGEGEISDKYH